MKNYLRLPIIAVLLSIYLLPCTGQANLNVRDTIFSNILQEQRDFRIILPENFDPANHLKYPVIYILDGDVMLNTLNTVYNNYWGHYMPHMILVGISNRTNRTRDLTTSQIKTRHGASMNQETGGAENFLAFIEKELIPHIDQKYPTTPYRTLIGHSYAGLFTINALINHPDIFANYLAIDPSLDWDNQKLLKEAKAKLETESFLGKSLFVTHAAEQIHMQDESVTINNVMNDSSEYTLFSRSIIDFCTTVEAQEQHNLNFSWRVYLEDLHGTVPLPSMREGLVFLFNWFQFKHPQKYNDPETPIAEIEELLEKQQGILSDNFGYPCPPMIEELLMGYGYMFMQYEQYEKAHLFFSKCIEYYPGSADGYSAMSEYYESQSDFQNSLVYATKAFEISGGDFDKKRVEELRAKQ